MPNPLGAASTSTRKTSHTTLHRGTATPRQRVWEETELFLLPTCMSSESLLIFERLYSTTLPGTRAIPPQNYELVKQTSLKTGRLKRHCTSSPYLIN